jgi:hypothetical protein
LVLVVRVDAVLSRLARDGLLTSSPAGPLDFATGSTSSLESGSIPRSRFEQRIPSAKTPVSDRARFRVTVALSAFFSSPRTVADRARRVGRFLISMDSTVARVLAISRLNTSMSWLNVGVDGREVAI